MTKLGVQRGQPILLGGSTWPGEEDVLFDILRELGTQAVEFKANQVGGFLKDGAIVKVELTLRGREKALAQLEPLAQRELDVGLGGLIFNMPAGSSPEEVRLAGEALATLR